MRYFYDRETDTVSLTFSAVFDWLGSEDLNGGAITVYLDRRSRPFAAEIRGASKLVNTLGLQPLEETAISHDEISRRMSWSEAGREAWSAIVRRMLVPHYYTAARRTRATA
jgi:hypothetical protein